MFFLFGLMIMASLGFMWLITGVYFLIAVLKKQTAQAILLAIPVFGLVFLVCQGIDYQKWAAEAKPETVFTAVFHTSPTPDVRALQGYRDEDELSPVYLKFQAPQSVVTHLTKGQFTLLPKDERTLFSVDYWKYPPKWFDTQITSQTQIFRLNHTLRTSNYLLLYEPHGETVRVYFEAPIGERM